MATNFPADGVRRGRRQVNHGCSRRSVGHQQRRAGAPRPDSLRHSRARQSDSVRAIQDVSQMCVLRARIAGLEAARPTSGRQSRGRRQPRAGQRDVSTTSSGSHSEIDNPVTIVVGVADFPETCRSVSACPLRYSELVRVRRFIFFTGGGVARPRRELKMMPLPRIHVSRHGMTAGTVHAPVSPWQVRSSRPDFQHLHERPQQFFFVARPSARGCNGRS